MIRKLATASLRAVSRMLMSGEVETTKSFSFRQKRVVSMVTGLIRAQFNRLTEQSVTPVTGS